MQLPSRMCGDCCRADKLMALRASLNEALAPSGGKLSLNDFIIKACALVRPLFNSNFPCGLVTCPAVQLQQLPLSRSWTRFAESRRWRSALCRWYHLPFTVMRGQAQQLPGEGCKAATEMHWSCLSG